jgi:hypothetical protein
MSSHGFILTLFCEFMCIFSVQYVLIIYMDLCELIRMQMNVNGFI